MARFFTYCGDYVLNYDTGERATLCVLTVTASAAECVCCRCCRCVPVDLIRCSSPPAVPVGTVSHVLIIWSITGLATSLSVPCWMSEQTCKENTLSRSDWNWNHFFMRHYGQCRSSEKAINIVKHEPSALGIQCLHVLFLVPGFIVDSLFAVLFKRLLIYDQPFSGEIRIWSFVFFSFWCQRGS